MSTTSAPPIEDVPLSSYEELKRARKWIRFPAGLDHFVWHLDGPLPTSSRVGKLTTKRPQWSHTTNKLKAVRPCTNTPDDTHRAQDFINYRSSLRPRTMGGNMGRVTWAPMSLGLKRRRVTRRHQIRAYPNYSLETDWWPSQSDKRPWHLACCGTKRPRGKDAAIVVKPTSENGFVTIHDYFSTVHPWLMGLRDDIPDAMGVMDAKPLPPETKLRVKFMGLNVLNIEDRRLQRTITEPHIT
ncbi:hypothetical protein F5Y07DRAFT_156763 [Xylaria sp. FL0933]|nr:hypothetical protein F5Y07DRAFT_156763 [Xylaria sp. FL0933]